MRNYYNPRSVRKNIFRNIYDSAAFKDVLRRRDSLPDFPFLVDVELTNHCNLDCIFCSRRTMTREKGFMSGDIFAKIADECARQRTPLRLIRWGEPFLHPQIFSFITYVKSKSLPLHITTNGLCLDRDKITRIVELELDSLIFSFQGATPAQYALMRNNGRYEQLKENILCLARIRGQKERPYIHISTTVTNETRQEIDDFVGYWAAVADYVSLGRTNLTKMTIFGSEQPKLLKRIKRLLPSETIEKTYQPCKEVYQKLSVDFDGKVSACCTDFNNFMQVGDLRQESLKDIWNGSPRLKAFRTLLDAMQHPSLTLCRACYQTTKV